jgi:hypothetical protein
MALKYLWVSKMKPICIPQIFYEDYEYINHYRQKKQPLFVFFYLKLSSFIANCFKYLWFSKMKPYVFLKFFYEDYEYINHYRQKTTLIFFFFNFKIWKFWPFYPTGTMSRIHNFDKRQCDRCQHRSPVKNTPPPSLSLPVPIPPPQHTHHPSANCPGPMISGLLDPVTSSANGVASLVQSIGIRSVPRPSPPPAQCP